MTEFDERVREIVASLAPGQIVSYGWVARVAGRPRAARAVGSFLARDGDDLPWWRVVHADGSLAPHQPADQAARLRAEGVPITGNRCAIPPDQP